METSPNIEPSDLYNRAKRNLVIFAGLLGIVVIGAAEANGSPLFGGFHLEPNAIPTVLFLATGYLVYQYWLAWSFQPEAVRQGRLNFEFIVTNLLASIALLTYLIYYLVYKLMGLNAGEILVWAAFVFALFVLAGMIAFILWSSASWYSAVRENKKLRTDTIKERLFEPGWVFIYNPKNPQGRRPISFNRDGTIGEGRHKNESGWRWDGKILELVRSDGVVHNRLSYDPRRDLFYSDEPSSVNKVRGQTIYQSGAQEGVAN